MEKSAGGVAQLGERVLCKHEVIGSIPFTSTSNVLCLGCEGGCGSEKSIAKQVQRGLIWLWFLTGGCGQFRLVHRLFFNNLEK